jgi:hypothetical protein
MIATGRGLQKRAKHMREFQSDDLQPDDARLFDRLVDGALAADERRQLLESLDGRPDGWRRCALAFLEAQAWRADFGEMTAGGEVPRRAEPAAAPAASAAPLADGNAGFRRSPSYAGRWLAVAAALFVAFVLGLAWQSGVDTMPGAPPLGSGAVAIETPPADDDARAAGPANEPRPARDAITLLVRDEGGAMRPVRVPLVDAQALDRELGLEFRSGITEAMRDRFQRSGYDLRSTRRYAPLWLENGQPLVVPVEDTRIVPLDAMAH